jgi:hypothetical protein
MKSFISFCNQLYLLFAYKVKMKDIRKRPQILPSLIFLCMVLAVAFRKKSLLEVDQISRTKEFRKFFNVQRKMVVSPLQNRTVFILKYVKSMFCNGVSDSTIVRSLFGFDFVPLRRYLKVIYLKAKQKGLCKVNVCGRDLRVGCIDGSQFGVFYGCVLFIVGQTDLFLDIEPAKNKGKELPASRELMEKTYKEYGDGFLDLILFDGLYADKKTINLCLSHNSDVLIKTDEESLNIINDAKGLFKQWKDFPKIEYKKGFDTKRMCEYEIWASDGFTFNFVDKPMKVANIKEKYVKKEQEVSFWVLCTALSLNSEQLRELAHIRWEIENNGFKQLNNQTHCDHVYTHFSHSFEALMLMLFIGWNLFALFSLGENLTEDYKGVKITYGFISELLKISFFTEYADSS